MAPTYSADPGDAGRSMAIAMGIPHVHKTRPDRTLADLLSFANGGAIPPKPTRRRLTIMSALATGWLPWGVQWNPSLTLAHDVSDKYPFNGVRPHFVLCCAHKMAPKEAQQFVSAGLLTAGVDLHGGEALVITEAGKTWLAQHWIS